MTVAAEPQPTSDARPRQGGGLLAVSVIDGASAAHRWHATDPLKLMLPRPRGQAVWACAATYGGGLVAGDELALDLEVGPGAALFLGTQSTTKIYRSEGRTATQRIGATVADGALLAMLPEPVSCFADSRFAQQVVLDVAPGGSLAWLDAVSAGRVACGERWDLESYISRIDLRLGGRLIARETLRLERGVPALAERFAGHAITAGLFLVGPRAAPAAEAARAFAISHRPGHDGLFAACSPLADGCLLRLAAVAHETLAIAVRSVLAPLAPALGGEPWRRLASVETACT